MPDQNIEVSLSEEQLRAAGFTESGTPRFIDTVKEYSNVLFARAIHYGDVDKAPNLLREITHEHVRAAAASMAKSFGKTAKSKWTTLGQIGEYIFTAIAGVGGGHLDNQYGIAAFGLGLSGAVILVVIRITNNKSE